MAIGGVSSAVGYVVAHPGQPLGSYVQSAAFWRAVGAGAVGGFIGGLIPGGGSLAAAIGYGMLGGALSAAGAQLFVNLTTPCANWWDGLLEAALVGGITGGVFGGVTFGIGRWLRPSRSAIILGSGDDYLGTLPTSDTSVVVPRGKISAQTMADLHRSTGDEFALVRANGKRILVRGTRFGVALPEGTTRLIAHTHIWSRLSPSGRDLRALESLKQAWSLIITEYGTVIRFP